MKNIIAAQPAPSTSQEYEAQFESLMQEAARLNELMDDDRVEIERLKFETKALGEETARLKAETRTLLTSMGAKV